MKQRGRQTAETSRQTYRCVCLIWSCPATSICICAVTSHLRVVLERLVWRAGEVEVEPRHPPVVAADNQVIPRGVDVNAADPFAPADELLHQHLIVRSAQSQTPRTHREKNNGCWYCTVTVAFDAWLEVAHSLDSATS